MSLHSSALCDGGTVLTAVVVHAVHQFECDLFREFRDEMFLHEPHRNHLYFDRVHFHDILISPHVSKGALILSAPLGQCYLRITPLESRAGIFKDYCWCSLPAVCAVS